MYYDVKYLSPNKIIGDHIAVEANSVIEAATNSPIMLCYGTSWTPDQFKVISVIPSTNIPITGENNE